MTRRPTEQRFEVGEFHRGERLDRFLQAMVPRMSRSSVQAALAEGRVELESGLEPKASRRLTQGERVLLRGRAPSGELPERPHVLAQGEGWVVVDKPAGLRSTPTARDPGRDVASLLFMSAAHRLDRFTSGCLLLTDSREAARHFETEFREGRVRKEYAAIVTDRPAEARWTRRDPIGPDPDSRVPGKVRVLPEGAPEARAAETLFELAASVETSRGPWTLLRAQPRTGRKHQVRVHAAASGHPLVGELLHAGDERDFVRWQLGQAVSAPPGVAPGRHLLHARALAFDAPEGGSHRVEAKWPADFPLDLTASWGSLEPLA